MKFGAGVSIPLRRKHPDFYGVGGFLTKFLSDFSRESYRVDGMVSDFANALTFTRSGSATYVDSTGTLQAAADGEPRMGHHVWDGSQWVNEGLLIESEARTNLITYSEDFTDASWTKSPGISVTSSVTESPAGIATADLLSQDAASDFRSIFVSSIPVSDATQYTFSIFLKKGTASQARLRVISGSSDISIFNINPSTGSGNGGSYQAEDYGNGWFRYSITITTDGTSAGVFIYPANSDAVTGDVYAWGAQFEQGSTPSSYIPTNGSTVTRAAETLTAPSANLPWWTDNITYLSDELVTNGDFGTGDLTGWTEQSTGTSSITVSGGAADFSGTDSSNRAILSQQVAASSGDLLLISIDITAFTSGLIFAGITSSSTFEGLTQNTSISSTGTIFLTVTAPSDNPYVFIWTSSLGGVATADNVSVREIETPAVSIAMEGLETYADEDTAGQVTLYDRRVDANNRITLTLDTDSTKTGTFTLTLVNGGSTETISTTGEITPGVNQPFNLAFVATSTELGIALNGTAETRVSHTLGLPDLSSTDATYEGMGARTIVREWAADVDEAEASQ